MQQNFWNLLAWTLRSVHSIDENENLSFVAITASHNPFRFQLTGPGFETAIYVDVLLSAVRSSGPKRINAPDTRKLDSNR